MSAILAEKNALVIGGSRGIGRAVVERLARDGAAVVVNYRENSAAAGEVAKNINAAGGRAYTQRADIGIMDDVRRLFDQSEEALGGLDIVVVNAGVAAIVPMVDATEADFDRVFNTNTKGAFFCLQEAARRVREGGRIVATSTVGTQMWFTETSIYLGSKAAVEQFVRVLSRELGPRGITVNAVLPGGTDTGLLPERDRVWAAGASPFNRIGEPEDVADVVGFLVSDDGRWLTGQLVKAGGGIV